MSAIEVGRICVKTVGREARKQCVIVDIIDGNFVLVTGPKELSGIRRRKCNVKHLEPTEYIIEIEKGDSDEKIKKILEKSNLIDRFKE